MQPETSLVQTAPTAIQSSLGRHFPATVYSGDIGVESRERGEIGNASLIRNLLIVIPRRLPRDLSGGRGRRQEQSNDGSRDGGLLRASDLQPALVAVDNFFADP